MSTAQGDFSRIVTDLSNQTFQRIEQQITARYGDDLLAKYRLAYATVPGRGPLLSENASLEFWNDVLDGLASVYHEYRDSLHGIVILHGTDTMSYIAPFLLFRIESLTFPIVLTGANTQPYEQQGESLLTTKSDAWDNIFNALLFIDKYGRSAPGVYVSFGSRICLPLNLRKVRRQSIRDRGFSPSELSSAGNRVLPTSVPTHLYRFENINLEAPYLARIIDGEIVASDLFVALRTIYGRLYRGDEPRFRKVSIPGRSCFLLKVSPALFPFFTDAAWPDRAIETWYELFENLSIVILEGYKSGTFPALHENSIRKFCTFCGERGISIVLTTRYGLHEGTYGSIEDFPFIYQPRMMISETALAAAYHVANELEEVFRRKGPFDLTQEYNHLLPTIRLAETRERLRRIEELFDPIRLSANPNRKESKA